MGVNLKKLGTFNWWLSSPNNYNGSNANEWNVNGAFGRLESYNVDSSTEGYPYTFRPTINLKKDIKFTGTGTSTDPYKIVTE